MEFSRELFSERLKELMEENDFNQSSLAEEIDIKVSSIHKYLHCTRQPGCANIAKLARIFNKKSDFILGISEDDTAPLYKINHFDSKKFSEILTVLMEENKKNRKQLSAGIDASISCICKWVRNERTPCADLVVALANVFDVSTDVILGFEPYQPAKINLKTSIEK